MKKKYWLAIFSIWHNIIIWWSYFNQKWQSCD